MIFSLNSTKDLSIEREESPTKGPEIFASVLVRWIRNERSDLQIIDCHRTYSSLAFCRCRRNLFSSPSCCVTSTRHVSMHRIHAQDHARQKQRRGFHVEGTCQLPMNTSLSAGPTWANYHRFRKSLFFFPCLLYEVRFSTPRDWGKCGLQGILTL